MVELKNGTDAQDHVVDIASITRAVDGLEIFPMSMLQLQETRVAQLLQTIRHQVENPLQKRIRTVIKAWQKLLEPGSSCATVVPLHRNLASNNNNGPVAAKLTTPNTIDSSQLIQSSNGCSNARNHLHHQELCTKPADRKKLSFTSTTANPNDCSPKPSHLNGRVSSLPPDAPKLSKVKSTAELIREAGGCIDSVTKDRILSNQIAKESDEFPRLVPLAAMRSSRKAKLPPVQLPSSTSSQQKPIPRHPDRALPPPPSAIPPSLQHTPSIPPIKSEVIAQFLDLAPIRVESPSTTHAISSNHNHRHHHHKEKRKHAKRRKEEGVEAESKDVMKDSKQPPIINHMTNWPTLPPLTEELMREAAETWLRDYHSGRTPSLVELGDVSRVGDLLQGTWPEVSASLDGEGRLQSMTALYSVDLGDDQLMHILPWTNLAGNRQTFFPPDTSTASAIDRLVDIPEPW